nr:MAG TPA: hypothetical protein [Caudoviricetes sp.]
MSDFEFQKVNSRAASKHSEQGEENETHNGREN